MRNKTVLYLYVFDLFEGDILCFNDVTAIALTAEQESLVMKYIA